nr:class I SAM-dependent methyltransferase [Actinomycetota bacterium]
MAPQLDRSVTERLSEAKQTTFFRAFLVQVERALVLPGMSSEDAEAIKEQVRGREEEFLCHHILPGLDGRLRANFVDALNQATLQRLTVLLCVMYAIPTHRPFLLAQEVCKPDSEAVERKMLRAALDYLAPASFFPTHLDRRDAQELRAKCPDAFAPACSMAEVQEASRALLEVIPGLGVRAEAAAHAHATLVASPSYFDYGCGTGPLLEAFADDFDVAGGDLYEGPAGALSRSIAILRTVTHPDDAVGADGTIESSCSASKVVQLDERPTNASPPPAAAFSVVTSNGVMEHVTKQATFDAVMAKKASLLRPGGLLIVNVSPTLLGYDGHHVLNPWLGVLLHRAPRLAEARRFEGRWRPGFTRPVGRRGLLRPLGDAFLA